METSIGSEMKDVRTVNEATAPIEQEQEWDDDEESAALGSLKKHPGWIQIEEYIQAMKIKLDSGFPEVDSVRAIGYHALVSQSIKNHLDAIQLMVEESYEYQREKRGGDGGEGTPKE